MKATIVLEWNGDYLGLTWMNKDNLAMLLYTGASTRDDLLKIESFAPEKEDE